MRYRKRRRCMPSSSLVPGVETTHDSGAFGIQVVLGQRCAPAPRLATVRGLGDLNSFEFFLSRALVTGSLPSDKWVLTSELCGAEGVGPKEGHHGLAVFTQVQHQLAPMGQVAQFASTLGAPSHLRADMLFLRRSSEAQDGVKASGTLDCLCRHDHEARSKITTAIRCRPCTWCRQLASVVWHHPQWRRYMWIGAAIWQGVCMTESHPQLSLAQTSWASLTRLCVSKRTSHI